PVFVMPAPESPFWSGASGNPISMPVSCPPNGTIIAPSGTGPLFGTASGYSVAQVGQTLTAVGNALYLKEAKGVAPYTWSLATGSLPDGLSLQAGTDDTSLPSITGTPIASGCSSFTVQVTDAVGVSATSDTLNLVVVAPALKVNAPIFHAALIDA